MGCCQSFILSTKQRMRSLNRKRNDFVIPEIVIEEYVPNYYIDEHIKDNTRDYVYLTEPQKLSPKWFIHNCDRFTADYLLRERPDGTYLVRESSRHKGQYVLAVSLYFFVHQLLIWKDEDGFGILGPGVHPTLASLIAHYSQQSLKSINAHIDTKLIYPIYGDIHENES